MPYLALIILLLSGLLAGCNFGRGDSSSADPAAVDSNVEPNSFLTFVNKSLAVDTQDYAKAYYKAVDPRGERETLEEWKIKTGFYETDVTHVTFRDTRDLGYGRDMYAWKIPKPGGGVAVYVDNYVVQLEPGDATTYDRLNLDAAVEQDRNFLFGTNAIEFSPESLDDLQNPDDTSPKIAKFFTFGSGSNAGEQQRLTAADLDGRGEKHMPMICVVCHGGTLYPRKPDGTFDPVSLKSPKLHILQQDSLQFSSSARYTEADQAPGIAAINEMVYETYETYAQEHPDDEQGKWDSAFAQELLKGAYSGGFDSTYDADFVPAGWKEASDRPSGVELLYKEVVEPHCIGCHSLRGTRVAKSKDNPSIDQYPNAVNFSSYEEFIAAKDLIIEYVYRRGIMPDSLINYTQFWKDPAGAPTLLATYLPGFDLLQNGQVVKPGRAVAKPGADERSIRQHPTCHPQS